MEYRKKNFRIGNDLFWLLKTLDYSLYCGSYLSCCERLLLWQNGIINIEGRMRVGKTIIYVFAHKFCCFCFYIFRFTQVIIRLRVNTGPNFSDFPFENSIIKKYELEYKYNISIHNTSNTEVSRTHIER